MNWIEVARGWVVGLYKYSDELLDSMVPEPPKLLKLFTAWRRFELGVSYLNQRFVQCEKKEEIILCYALQNHSLCLVMVSIVSAFELL